MSTKLQQSNKKLEALAAFGEGDGACFGKVISVLGRTEASLELGAQPTLNVL